MRLSIIALALLAVASMAVAADPSLTWTITKVGTLNNNNGHAIVTNTGTDGTGNMTLNASNTLWDVAIYTNDPTGSTLGSWALNITSTATVGTIYQSLGNRYNDTVVDTQALATTYDSPTSASSNYKNANYAKAADTWLGSNFALIGSPGVFTAPVLDVDGNVAHSPNEWDLHVGTAAGQDFGNILVGQWCVNGALSFILQVKGTVARNGVQYDLGTLNISPDPEPVTLSLLGLGSLALLRRRK